MQVVLLTFVVAVSNLWLGYVLAVHWHERPRTPWTMWRRWRFWRPTVKGSTGQPAATEDNAEEAASSPEEPLPAESEEVSDAVAESGLSDLERLRQFVNKAVARLMELTGVLTKGKGKQSDSSAWSLVGELREVCDAYIRHLNKVSERLFDDPRDLGQARAVSDEVEGIILEQVAQLETTLSNLHYMDFDSGMSAAMKRLTAETENTLATARRLQKALEPEPETTDDKAAESPSAVA